MALMINHFNVFLKPWEMASYDGYEENTSMNIKFFVSSSTYILKY